jgi:Tfp pilus assembly protein PilO
MAADYQMTFRRYGRFYKNVRQQMKRKEVLVSTNIILTFFTISFFAIFAIRPTALTISKLWREIKDKKSVQTQLDQKISDLAEAQQALDSMEEDLILLTNAIPPTMEFSRFVQTIEYLVLTKNLIMSSNRFNNIELYVSAEEASASAAQIVTHPFSLSLKGSFSSIV